MKNLNVADSASLTLERLSLTIQFMYRLSPPSGSGGNGGRFFAVFPAIFFALWFAKTLSVCIFNSVDHCYSQADCDTSGPCSLSSRS